MIKVPATWSYSQSVLSLQREVPELHPLLHHRSRRILEFRVDKMKVPFIMIIASGFLDTQLRVTGFRRIL